MSTLFDYMERSVTGPIMTQKDFQMKILIPNVRKIVNEFEIKSPSPAIQGQTYPELYDVKTQNRSEEYSRLVDEVVEELVQLGVPFS